MLVSARKGTFGHGMSAGGGWELTAQYLGYESGELFPSPVVEKDLNPSIAGLHQRIVFDVACPAPAGLGGKLSMGIGGINACVISRPWNEEPGGPGQLPEWRLKICGMFCEKAERASTMSQPASCACCFNSHLHVRKIADQADTLRVRFALEPGDQFIGFTASKFRSKMIRDGLAFGLLQEFGGILHELQRQPARFAASVSLTEKKRSVTAARTLLGTCFCIGVCRFSANTLVSELGGGDDMILPWNTWTSIPGRAPA